MGIKGDELFNETTECLFIAEEGISEKVNDLRQYGDFRLVFETTFELGYTVPRQHLIEIPESRA